MTWSVAILALSAAVLHASWNAVLRTGTDRFFSISMMSAACAVVTIPLVIVLPLPPTGAWPFLGTSAVMQVGYSLLLVAAYRHGDLGQVYPIVRGTVPMLVTAGGFVFAHQQLSGRAVLGVTLVAVGVAGLSLGRGRAPLRTLAFAAATVVVIAAYNTVDAVAVQEHARPATYAAWTCLLYGLLLPATFLAVRGRTAARALGRREIGRALIGGVISLAAYGAVILAFSRGPAGPITALRETSVVFAALISRFLLRERSTRARVLGCVTVAVGAAVLA